MEARVKKPAICFMIAAIMLAPSSLVFAQDPKEELTGLLERIEALVTTLHQQGYIIVHIEVDKLREDQTYTASRKLFSANDYAIVGVGGIGISDLDLELYDENDNLVDKDESEDNLPVLEVSPKKDGKYYIKTKLYSLDENADADSEYFFCWVIGFKRTE